MTEQAGSKPNQPQGGNGKTQRRIGVYVCHCGTNIAGRVNVDEVAKYAATLPGVVVSRDYKFFCSDPGQDIIVKDIRDQKLDGVVVASCSPRMHEPTFRRTVQRGGLNAYLMTMANIREHCSWVTIDGPAATEKAKALVRAAIRRASCLTPLDTKEVPVNQASLVIGGGIAGIQAALEIATAGKKVYLVEKTSSIGGHMAQFDKTFPTLDCSACILTPKMVSVGQHKNIELLTYSEVEEVAGYVGNFKVKVRKKSRRVDDEKCNGCGICWQNCPAVAAPRHRQILLGGVPVKPAGSPKAAFSDSTHKPDAGPTLQRMWAQYEKRCSEKGAGECSMCALCVRMCKDVVGANVLAIEKTPGDKSPGKIVAKSPERCLECGACASICHAKHLKVVPLDPADAPPQAQNIKNEVLLHELMLGPNKAVGIPFMQAVPAIPVIDPEFCIHLRTGGCGACKQLCERAAIDYTAPDKHVEFEAGTIVTATGFKPFDATKLTQYGYGKYKNVMTALEFEKLNNASGPTGGKIVCADGKAPEAIALIHCVGSRDKNHNEHCSRVCCMMSLKYAHLIHEKTQAAIYDFYIDMRCFGKGYEEFYNRLLEEGVFFIRGRAGEISDFAIYDEERGKLVVRCEDTLIGVVRRIPVDMAVLMTGLEPAADMESVARLLNLSRTKDGFFLEQHPKLGPVATPTDGIFIAGCCQGPKDIPDTVAQASAAAAAALSLSMRGKVEVEPISCKVDADACAGCKLCNTLCPYSAITFDGVAEVSVVNDAVCKGCGTCAAACPSGAILARHFTDRQLLDEIAGVCQ